MTQRPSFDVDAWVRVQLTRRNGPSDAWLVDYIVGNFHLDFESANAVLAKAKDSDPS